ncbi:uncharacterized protein LOC144354629, partial [Saccoglossus kowalevskii]
MGPKMYALLRNLLSPDRPTDKTLDQVVDILEKHLSPKPLIIAERFRFFKRDQHAGESVNSYVAELRRLAKSCDFGNYLNDALRDRLPTTSSKPCYRCGRKGHTPQQCRFKDAECHCKKKGHIQKVCRSKGTSKGRKVHVLDENVDSDESDILGTIHEVNVIEKPRSQPIWITPLVEGKSIQMELDTGASVSLISNDDYEKYFKGMRLRKSSITLKAFNGHQRENRCNCRLQG